MEQKQRRHGDDSTIGEQLVPEDMLDEVPSIDEVVPKMRCIAGQVPNIEIAKAKQQGLKPCLLCGGFHG